MIVSSLAGAQSLPDAPQPNTGVATLDLNTLKEQSRYPHAMLVLETSVLATAAVENCRHYASDEYYVGGIERHRSGARCAEVWAPISAGAFALGSKLQRSPRKAVRIAGHGIMWGTVAAIAINYFTRSGE